MRCTESLPERATWRGAFGGHTAGTARHFLVLLALALLTRSLPIVIVAASNRIGPKLMLCHGTIEAESALEGVA
jgi:hypothetical protein